MEIAKSYDSMPYPSKFFGQTYPDRLATLATLFGIEAKPPESSRVLELGCGNGSNLLSHAYILQDSKFVGVDISGKHIEQAKEWANELNLKNIEFQEIDVMNMTVEDYGKFDYITAHGLISWVPDFVSEKVFSIYSEMLEEDGIGYLSYNAYPGSHYRDMVRQVMRFHTRHIEDPLEKVQNSIGFLSTLAESSTETKIYQPILEFELQRHFRHSASDIYHDDLADAYQPYYFHEFANKLKENNLQFLCETELHAMSIQNFPPQVQDLIKQKEDLIEREQYIDFFLGRIFRQSLFCHESIKINREIDSSMVDKFMIASDIKPADINAETTTQKVEKFVGSKGFGIEIDHPPTKTALKLLGESWGRAINFPQLLQEVRQILSKSDYSPDDWEKELSITRAILFQIYQGTDLVELHLHQGDAFQEISETPKINDLCRWQITCAENITTLFYINIKIEDQVSKRLLELLDGTRNHEQLLEEITEFIKTNDEIEDKEELLSNIDNWMNESLSKLAQLGMFVS